MRIFFERDGSNWVETVVGETHAEHSSRGVEPTTHNSSPFPCTISTPPSSTAIYIVIRGEPRTFRKLGAGVIIGIVLISIALLVFLRISLVYFKLCKRRIKEKMTPRSLSLMEMPKRASTPLWGSLRVGPYPEELGQRRESVAIRRESSVRSLDFITVEPTTETSSPMSPGVAVTEELGGARQDEESEERESEIEGEDADEGIERTEGTEEVDEGTEEVGEVIGIPDGIREERVADQQPDEELETAHAADTSAGRSQPTTLARRSISERSTTTTMSDPPPPYNAPGHFNPDGLDLSQVSSAPSYTEMKEL
ncbi:hypothetical protein BDY19DRAFT_385716 [Irpex rosettiformis]|uniref:Uncharacterized protein n=1 Tax=Irpex rosettiformis TaxID=378272 RepID=A0ACB8TV71_9APHY|nr:hypothetical protein BDY19DRAFT_385716 [Irpex rosettiformis]